eukprot:gene57578-biopygen111990
MMGIKDVKTHRHSKLLLSLLSDDPSARKTAPDALRLISTIPYCTEDVDLAITQHLSPRYWTLPRCAVPGKIPPKRVDVTEDWAAEMQALVDQTFVFPRGQYSMHLDTDTNAGKFLRSGSKGLSLGDWSNGDRHLIWEILPHPDGSYRIQATAPDLGENSHLTTSDGGAGFTLTSTEAAAGKTEARRSFKMDAHGIALVVNASGTTDKGKRRVHAADVQCEPGLWILELLRDHRGTDGRNLRHLGLEVVKVERNENTDLWLDY